MKVGVCMLMGVLLLNLTSCCDDPDCDNVTPPAVPEGPNTLTGMVTAISGEAISGATVTLGTTSVKSDANGIYLFPDVKAGTHIIKVEAVGKRAKESKITVEDSKKTQNLIWNAVLAKDAREEIVVSATQETDGGTETEALKDNDLAIVDVEATVPAGAVEAADDIIIYLEPIYSADEAETVGRSVARAAEPTLMVGAALSVNKAGVTLKKPIELGFNVGDEVAQVVEAKQFVNGEWVAVASRIENGKVIIDATEFTSYGLFLGVTFFASNSSEPLVFNRSEWNNLYGAKDMPVGSAEYGYRVGTDIDTRGTTVFTALLIEKLAQIYGTTVYTVNGTYPLNVTLPVGTALTVSGFQSKQKVSASALRREASGTHYGTVTVVATAYNRQHTGGSSGW